MGDSIFKGESLKTITTDNGSEFAAHQEITRKLGCPIYFTDAYSSWQKGAIENANKLIRQYIPKEKEFEKVSEQYLKKIAYKINERPREKLKFKTPKRQAYKHIHQLCTCLLTIYFPKTLRHTYIDNNMFTSKVIIFL